MPGITATITAFILTILFLLVKPVAARGYPRSGSKTLHTVSGFSLVKLTGVVLFGVLPLLVLLSSGVDPAEYGLQKGDNAGYWYLFIGLPLLIVAISAFASRNQETMNLYPDLKFRTWTPGRLTILTAGWLLYLTAYEFLFRGFLFFSCYYSFGFTTAAIINIVLYSLAHIPKGIKETAGAIPFGLLLCWITWLTGSIWIPLIAHLSLALSTQYFAIYHHAEMKFRWSVKSSKVL